MESTMDSRFIRLAEQAVSRLSLVVAAIALVVAAAGNLRAQEALKGQTPLGLAPGAPAGAYALSDFDNVNLFNGGLSFRLPLISAGGRGSVNTTVALPIEQKWIVDSFQDFQGNTFYTS